ncbi:MAG: hypothetical protein EAZ15_00360 [Sphingobacteriales bacterium]|nr:MAG: hypothetical protein EAZ15_00360 [Sphingobacteriales bacterium]
MPSKEHYIYDFSDEFIIIEEQNVDGFSRICFSEISEKIVNPKTFKTDFIYTNIVSDYHDDWITAECNGIEIWKHFTEWQALVCTPINRFDGTETNSI